MVSKPARFALQQSPLAILCRDLALDVDDATEVLGISHAHIRFYVEHTREFTPEAWTEIVSMLMASNPKQRVSLTIFDFLGDEDAAIVRKAFGNGDKA